MGLRIFRQQNISNKELKAEKAKLDVDINNRQGLSEELARQIAELKQTAKKEQSVLNGLEKDISALETTQSNLLGVISGLNSDISGLKSKKESKEKQIAVVERETEKLLAEREKGLNDIVENINREIDEQNKALSSVKEKIEIETGVGESLAAEFVKTELRLNNAENEIGELDAEAKEKTRIIGDLNKEIGELTGSRDELLLMKGSKDDLSNTLLSLKDGIKHTGEELELLKKQKLELEKKVKELSDELQTEKFKIGQEKDLLRRKEAFIKEKYEKAGIAY